MKLNKAIIGICALWLSLSLQCGAIDYIFTGSGAGPLGSTSFDTAFEIDLHLNPANLFYNPVYTAPAISNVVGSITLRGVGTATFLDSLTVVGHGSGYGEVMIGDAWRTPWPYLNFMLSFFSTKLEEYDLVSTSGPVGADQIGGGNSPVHTSMGDFYFSRLDFPLTFEAVPEPSVFALLALCGGALLCYRRMLQ